MIWSLAKLVASRGGGNVVAIESEEGEVETLGMATSGGGSSDGISRPEFWGLRSEGVRQANPLLNY